MPILLHPSVCCVSSSCTSSTHGLAVCISTQSWWQNNEFPKVCINTTKVSINSGRRALPWKEHTISLPGKILLSRDHSWLRYRLQLWLKPRVGSSLKSQTLASWSECVQSKWNCVSYIAWFILALERVAVLITVETHKPVFRYPCSCCPIWNIELHK